MGRMCWKKDAEYRQGGNQRAGSYGYPSKMGFFMLGVEKGMAVEEMDFTTGDGRSETEARFFSVGLARTTGVRGDIDS